MQMARRRTRARRPGSEDRTLPPFDGLIGDAGLGGGAATSPSSFTSLPDQGGGVGSAGSGPAAPAIGDR
ncbi:hypothetical protein GCM10009527_076600 [Actinomadura nitritigenes]|uniref:Uncharacterized protein n=1 Tax=Actinomadura nitritigenes TaxID=134602 RepID=A0ABS3RHR4_9ACTN|nr:hypothetical protein [Actinomadura nitritigenes]MBO2445163.1 hypothetical protein [Actinomadura nitritigenes]